MAGGAGFVMDSNNTLRNNKGIRTRRSFLNGVGNDVKLSSFVTSKKSTKEEILFHKRMKNAKLRGMKREMMMYGLSFLIVMLFFLILNQIIS